MPFYFELLVNKKEKETWLCVDLEQQKNMQGGFHFSQ
jgi:hypothetical protein